MVSKGNTLTDRLASLDSIELADYVSVRRDLVEEFITSVSSSESRKKLQTLQHSIDQLRTLNGGTSQSLPELFALIRNSLQEIVTLTDRAKQETTGK